MSRMTHIILLIMDMDGLNIDEKVLYNQFLFNYI